LPPFRHLRPGGAVRFVLMAPQAAYRRRVVGLQRLARELLSGPDREGPETRGWKQGMRNTHLMRTLWLLVVGQLLLAVSGCAGMVNTPDHERPDVIPKSDWSMALASDYAVDLEWWEGFDDPRLNELVDLAIANNPDLKVLAARTEQARAQISQAEALRLPVVNLGTRTDTPQVTGFGTDTKFGTGGEVIWELDVGGKARKGIEAQAAGFRASQAEWRAGYLVLVAGVVDGYFQIRQFDRQLAQQRRARSQNERILEIYRKLHARGLAPSSRLTQQEAELHAIRVGIEEQQRARALTENALAALVGAVPGEFRVPDTSDRDAVAVPEVPAGLPADLLSRRPDLLAAEYRLLQQVNVEGQARLSQLPTVGLTGIGGSASMGLSNLLDTWTAGLSSVLQFPVFDPNVRARIRVSEAQVKVAEQEYRAAVLRAFEEVESILINLQSRRAQRQDLLARRDKLREVGRLLDRQLELGLLSHLDVLEQQRALLDAERALIENEWLIATDTVALFKAVGGGWPEEVPGAEV